MSRDEVTSLLRAAAVNWVHDYAQSMGAALAFYTMFSIAPFYLSSVPSPALSSAKELSVLRSFINCRACSERRALWPVQGLLESARKPTGSVLAVVVGIVFLMIGSTAVFAELQDAFDRIWRVPARVSSRFSLWRLARARLLSFGLVLGIGFLLMVSLTFSAGLDALSRWWHPRFGGWTTVAYIFDVTVGIVLSTTVFAMIYKLMPRVDIDWKDVWIGAVVNSLQIRDRSVPREKWGQHALWASRVPRRGLAVGLLLCPGLLVWRGIHLGLFPQIRLAEGKPTN